MLNQLNTFSATHAVVVYIYALLFTQHICLFLDLSRFQKHPLGPLNYLNAGLLSALITAVSFFTLRFSSLTHKVMWVAVIGFVSAAVITLTLQRLSHAVFSRQKGTTQQPTEQSTNQSMNSETLSY